MAATAKKAAPKKAAKSTDLDLVPREDDIVIDNSNDNNSMQLPAAKSEAGTLMTVIERISQMPDLTEEKMGQVERLFSMHQQVIDRDHERLFNEAMALAQAEIQGVVAKKENQHTKSTFADLDAIHKSAKPVWTKHGFSVMTTTSPAEGNFINVNCEIRHKAGHKVCFTDTWPMDLAGKDGTVNKTAIQARGSSITYARRYTECMVFDISIDRDTDGNAPPAGDDVITEEQVKTISEALDERGIDVQEFLSVARVESISEIMKGRFQSAMGWINKNGSVEA